MAVYDQFLSYFSCLIKKYFDKLSIKSTKEIKALHPDSYRDSAQATPPNTKRHATARVFQMMIVR
ncbi:MAG: hypothetical protein IPI93_13430 [Sphingobacteriaceae bacterium]|nr:hypothetical protein [Sphingobacteriaceae bacterium]MBK7819222.1 hypothetical protein [Sphingobacteriaceae bacterium]